MKQHHLKLSVAAATLLALTACGGGGGGEDPNANNGGNTSARELRPLGSPGYFVPDGQNSITVALSNCSARTNTGGTPGSVPITTTQPVTNGSLTIYANGDVVFSAAVGSATTASEVVRIDQSTPASREINYVTDNAIGRSGQLIFRLDYGMNVDDGANAMAVDTNDSTTGSFSLSASNGVTYSCDTPQEAFSMPATITNQRLALLAAGATGITASQLYSSDQLDTSVANTATWHAANGPTSDALSSSISQFANARYVRFDWSGNGGIQGAQFLTSPSVNGTYSPQGMPPRVSNNSEEFRSTYLESSDNLGTPVDTRIEAVTRYDSASTLTSYNIDVHRLARSNNSVEVQPVASLSTESFSYGSGLDGFPVMPNGYLSASGNAQFTLANCTQVRNSVSTPVQRSVQFTADQRVLWKNASTRSELFVFAPSSNDSNRLLEIRTNAVDGLPALMRYDLTGPTNSGYSLRIPDRFFGDTPSIVATYTDNGVTVTDTCEAPADLNNLSSGVNMAAVVASRLSFATQGQRVQSPLTAQSNIDCSINITHAITTTGGVESRGSTYDTALPAQSGAFTAWNTWAQLPGVSSFRQELRETYTSQAGAKVYMRNPTATCISGPYTNYFTLELTPQVNALPVVSASSSWPFP